MVQFISFSAILTATAAFALISSVASAHSNCVGCPFDDHRGFYKYSQERFTVETDDKGVFPVFYGGEVVSVLGDDRHGRKHEGIDIKASSGSTVVAAWSGRVYFSGWNALGGWAVILKHKNGYVTYYAHLKTKPSVKVGQWVVAGQRVGAVGKTGNAQATIPHLHFEVSKNSGRRLNPLRIL